MIPIIGDAEPAPYGALVAATVFVVLAMWAGVRLWRGQWPGPSGPRPRYQTYFGGAYLAVPFGAGFLVIAVSGDGFSFGVTATADTGQASIAGSTDCLEPGPE